VYLVDGDCLYKLNWIIDKGGKCHRQHEIFFNERFFELEKRGDIKAGRFFTGSSA
jgi:hypothetical protein